MANVETGANAQYAVVLLMRPDVLMLRRLPVEALLVAPPPAAVRAANGSITASPHFFFYRFHDFFFMLPRVALGPSSKVMWAPLPFLSVRAWLGANATESESISAVCAILFTAMRCVRPAASRAISAHPGGTVSRCVQARVPFLPVLTAQGVMPVSQGEGLLREPGRPLFSFADFSFPYRDPLPCKTQPSREITRSFHSLGLTGAGYTRAAVTMADLGCHVTLHRATPTSKSRKLQR